MYQAEGSANAFDAKVDEVERVVNELHLELASMRVGNVGLIHTRKKLARTNAQLDTILTRVRTLTREEGSQ